MGIKPGETLKLQDTGQKINTNRTQSTMMTVALPISTHTAQQKEKERAQGDGDADGDSSVGSDIHSGALVSAAVICTICRRCSSPTECSLLFLSSAAAVPPSAAAAAVAANHDDDGVGQRGLAANTDDDRLRCPGHDRDVHSWIDAMHVLQLAMDRRCRCDSCNICSIGLMCCCRRT